ncbi:hypothetical protein ACVOMV_26140 (plasmid) [Mesorhizobium atlanticum]
MNVILGFINIRYEAVDKPVVIAEKFCIIAGQRGELAKISESR